MEKIQSPVQPVSYELECCPPLLNRVISFTAYIAGAKEVLQSALVGPWALSFAAAAAAAAMARLLMAAVGVAVGDDVTEPSGTASSLPNPTFTVDMEWAYSLLPILLTTASLARSASSTVVKLTKAHSRSGKIRMLSMMPNLEKIICSSLVVWGVSSSWPSHRDRVGIWFAETSNTQAEESIIAMSARFTLLLESCS